MSVAAARGFLLHPQNALKVLFIRRSLCSFRPFFKTLRVLLSRPQNQFKFNDQQKQSQKPSRNVKENASLWHHLSTTLGTGHLNSKSVANRLLSNKCTSVRISSNANCALGVGKIKIQSRI